MRPLVSLIEKDVLNDFTKTLTTTESRLCCCGTIKLPADQKLSLLYKVEGNGQARSFEFPSEDNDPGVQQLLDACKPSPLGRGNETVYDESYRLACELLDGHFALTKDILSGNTVLATIAALTASRNPEDRIVARLHKLNAYAVGGFSKSHRDIPKSEHHIGTLVVTLPVPFEGGALRMSHEGKHVLFDCSKDINPQAHDIRLPWAFLFSDVEHEVLPVTSGTCVTLDYDIFTSDKPELPSWPSMDYTAIPLYPDLKALLENQQFLPGGGRLAVALSNVYPIDVRTSSETFTGHLKGADAALYSALSTLGVPVSLQAVFCPDPSKIFFDISEEELPEDGFGPSGTITGEIGKRSRTIFVLYTSEKLQDYDMCYQGDEIEFLESVWGANLDIDLIWARKPSRKDFSERSGSYVVCDDPIYPLLGFVYSAVAFVLEIPPVGHIVRESH